MVMKKGSFRGQAAIESPSATARSLKGQAAMEYLMTYGWAILVIVIVLAVLLFLNPFKAPETCLFQQPGFSCSESVPQVYQPTDTTLGTQVSATIYNKLGQGVKNVVIVCTNAAVGDIDYATMKTYALTPDGGKITAGGSVNFKGTCVDKEGNKLTLAPNAQFKGVLAVWYLYDYDDEATGVMRSSSATLVSTVLNQVTTTN